MSAAGITGAATHGSRTETTRPSHEQREPADGGATPDDALGRELRRLSVLQRRAAADRRRRRRPLGAPA